MTQDKGLFNLHRVILLLALPPILYYIYHQLLDGWDRLEEYRWVLNPGYLGLSMLMAFLYFVLTSWIWHRLLSYLGSNLSFWRCFRILQLAQLGKYLPGRIWTIGGQLYLGEREGVPRATLIWAMGLHAFFNLIAGAVIFLPYLYLFAHPAVAASGTLIFLFLLILGFFPRPMLWLLSRWGMPSSGLLRLSPGQSFSILSVFVLAWILFGFSFWILINAFTNVPLGAYYKVLASFCGAWVVGVLSVFTPAGIGVREGALVYLLGQFLLPSMAVIISIAARLWITVVELFCAAIAWLSA